MEARLKNLSNFALWLDRNKTTTGWGFEGVDLQNAAEALWRPERIKVRPQPDVDRANARVVQVAWKALKEGRSGLTQERMLTAPGNGAQP